MPTIAHTRTNGETTNAPHEGHRHRHDHCPDAERPQRPVRDVGPQRSALHLVESVGSDSEPDGECRQGPTQDQPIELGGESGSDGHIGEMPQRVGDMEQGYDIAGERAGGA